MTAKRHGADLILIRFFHAVLAQPLVFMLLHRVDACTARLSRFDILLTSHRPPGLCGALVVPHATWLSDFVGLCSFMLPYSLFYSRR